MPKAQWINKIFQAGSTKGLNQIVKKAVFLNADKGDCVAIIKLTENDLNPFGGMHGGFSAALIDTISSYGLMTHANWPNLALSLALNLNYMKPGSPEDELKVISKVLRAGSTIAFLDVEIWNAKTNEILVKAEHTKFQR